MANLTDFSTINSRVKRIAEDYYAESDKSYSLAFLHLVLTQLFEEINDEDVSDYITDGGDDGGFDAVYFDDEKNVINIINTEYAMDIKSSNSNFSGKEIESIISTISRMNAGKLNRTEFNPQAWESIQKIIQLHHDTTPLCNIYICTNKESPIKKVQNQLINFTEQFGNFKCFFYGQNEIASKIIQNKFKPKNQEIQLVNKEYFEHSSYNLKGIMATLSADQLLKLVMNENDEIDESVFNENVRVFMNLDNDINKNIYDYSIKEDNYKFWYLNNGITIVCDEFIYSTFGNSPKINLMNYQIVNGGQTTHAIYKAYRSGNPNINNLYIIARICSTKDDRTISDLISETTNSQTPVETRDLKSNEKIQIKLEEQFSILSYYYERKKNQYEDKPKDKRLDAELLAQLFLAYYLDMPSEAKNDKRKIFSKYYSQIFNNDIDADKLLLPYLFYKPLKIMKDAIASDKRKRKHIDDNNFYVSIATLHILNVIKYVIINENISLDKAKEDVNALISKSIAIVNEVIIEQINLRGKSFDADKMFKESSTNKLIKEKIEVIYNKPKTLST